MGLPIADQPGHRQAHQLTQAAVLNRGVHQRGALWNPHQMQLADQVPNGGEPGLQDFEVGMSLQTLDALFGTEGEDLVIRLKHPFRELYALQPIAASNADHYQADPVPESELLQIEADHGRARQDPGSHAPHTTHRARQLRDLDLLDLEILHSQQLAEIVRQAIHHQDISTAQHRVATRHLATLVSRLNGQHLDAQGVPETGLGQSHSIEGRVVWKPNGEQVLLELIHLTQVAQLGLSRAMLLPCWQELAPECQHVDDPERQKSQAHRSEIEERERFEPSLSQHLCGQDVRGGSHQGRGSTENGTEGQGHEQTAWSKSGPPRDGRHGWHQHSCGSDVVHERRKDSTSHHQHDDETRLAVAHEPVDPSTDDIRHAGFEKRCTDGEDRQHGDHRRRREAREGLRRREVAREDQRGEPQECRQVHWQFFGEKQIHHHRQQGEQECDLWRHGTILPLGLEAVGDHGRRDSGRRREPGTTTSAPP